MAEAGAYQRVAALLELGRHAEAEALIRQRLAQEPHDFLFLAQLARSLIGQRKAKEAVEAGRELVAQRPESATAHRLLSVGHAMRGRLRLAEAAARQAVALDPQEGWNHYTLANTMRANGVRRGEMRAASRRAVELDPDEADFHILVGALHRRKDRELARRSFEEALRLEPENAQAQRLLTETRTRGFELVGMVDGLQHALRLDPTAPEEALDSLAERLRRIVFWLSVVWLCAFVALVFAMAGGGAASVAARLVVGAGLVGLALCAYRFHRRLPEGGWRLLWQALRRQPLLALTTVSTAICYATCAAAVLSDAGWAAAVVGLGAVQRYGVFWIVRGWALLQLPVLLGRLAWLKGRAMWPAGKR